LLTLACSRNVRHFVYNSIIIILCTEKIQIFSFIDDNILLFTLITTFHIILLNSMCVSIGE